jgi:AraC-like DNA-binding protein
LQQLAENIDVHSNVLSYVINTTLGKNFYDLINEYRIEEFINLYQNSYDKYTILHLLSIQVLILNQHSTEISKR